MKQATPLKTSFWLLMNPSTFIAPCPLFCFLFNCFLEHQHFKSVSTTCRIMPSSWINVFLLQWNSWVFLAPWCALCVTRRIAVLFLGNSWACHSPGKTKEENHFSLVSLLYPLSWSSFNCPPRFFFFFCCFPWTESTALAWNSCFSKHWCA